MSKNTGSHITSRAPIGADQRAKWKQALSDRHRQQRSQRGRRKRGLDAVTGPGMVRPTMGRTGAG